jgi:polyhydroxybutyrate depolymerase
MKILLSILFILGITAVNAQQTITSSIMHDGLQRSYILYIPASYSAGTDAPLVLNFHGYTSNATEQLFYGDFRPIADTAGFLLVHPEGTLDGSNQTYWNADWGGTVDDIGFTAALIDSLSAQYSINQDRVYSTGMSNGGFMSYTLACSLSDRIAAIASVTGSMNTGQSLNCNPQHPMPVMEIHGTADAVVPYTGNVNISPISSVLAYWVNNNVCDVTPIETAVPDLVLGDGCTATHFVYENGNSGVEVEHYRINLGGHTWPGAPVALGTTNYDISASEKIWEFFAQYDIYGKISANVEGLDAVTLHVYPNPAQSVIQLEGIDMQLGTTVEIQNSYGKTVAFFNQPQAELDVSKLPSGVYFLRVLNDNTIHSVKFMKQ